MKEGMKKRLRGAKNSHRKFLADGMSCGNHNWKKNRTTQYYRA